MKNRKTVAAPSAKISKTRFIILIGILAGMGIILHFIESLLPVLAPVPGARLGLANIITLIALVILGSQGGGMVLFLRILLGSLLAGTFLTFPFYLSLLGGFLAFMVMVGALVLGGERLSLVGISVLGAVAHNIGQLLGAAFFVRSWGVFYYLPYLVLLGVPTGILIGLAARLVLNVLRRGRI